MSDLWENLVEKAHFAFKITGIALDRPASPDKLKAPLA